MIEAGGAEDTAHRHLRYFRDLFERVRDAYEHFPSEAHVLALQVELSNARAALDFGVTYDPDAAAILLTATVLWGLLGRPAESMQRAEQLISLVRDRRLTSRLWERVAAASINLGLYSRGLTAAEKSIEAAIDCRDSVLEVGARCRQLYCLSVLGVDIEAAMNSLAACNAFKLPTPRLELWLVLAQTQVALAQADLDGKTALAERNVILEKRFGNRRGVGNALIMLSTIEHERGNTLKAIQISRDVMESAFALEDKSVVTWNLANMVGYYVAVDDLDNARQVAALALSVLRERPDGDVPKFLIEHIALFGALSGDYSRAAQLSGFVSRENLMDEYQREYAERVTCERLADILHQSLPEAELAQTLEAGKTLTLMDALEVAAACVAYDGGAAAVKQG